jgi:hypothetical protein
LDEQENSTLMELRSEKQKLLQDNSELQQEVQRLQQQNALVTEHLKSLEASLQEERQKKQSLVDSSQTGSSNDSHDMDDTLFKKSVEQEKYVP